MKKTTVLFMFVIMVLLSGTLAFAGSIPEDLLHDDNAQLFFAEVIKTYTPSGDKPYVEVKPVKVIKGDVRIGREQVIVYYNPNTVGDFDVKFGNVYLFTYFDENNPTDIFEVTSYDTSVLKLKNVEGDMWKRFEKYLNEGRYEEAEQERIDRQNENLPIQGGDILLADLIGVKKEEAQSVEINCNGEFHEIDVDEFYKAIENITLTDIKDVSLEKEIKDGFFAFPGGMYIMVNGFDGYAFITDDCKVDKYGMHHSNMPNGKYTMKYTDRAKITALFTDEGYKLPLLETPIAKSIFFIVISAGVLFAAGFGIGFAVKIKRKRS